MCDWMVEANTWRLMQDTVLHSLRTPATFTSAPDQSANLEDEWPELLENEIPETWHLNQAQFQSMVMGEEEPGNIYSYDDEKCDA